MMGKVEKWKIFLEGKRKVKNGISISMYAK